MEELNTEVYVGYVKDIFNVLVQRPIYADSLHEDIMNDVIKLIKQAKEAFN